MPKTDLRWKFKTESMRKMVDLDRTATLARSKSSCVEIRFGPDQVGVRDSKAPAKVFALSVTFGPSRSDLQIK